MDYSLELLVEPVRGANSSTGQHNIAAPTSTEDYRKPSLRPVPRVHSSPHPDADVLALDRHHNGGERGDQVQQESKLNFNFLQIQNDGRRQVSVNQNSDKFKMQVSYQVLHKSREKCDAPVHGKPHQYELPHVHVQHQHPDGQGEWSDAGRHL